MRNRLKLASVIAVVALAALAIGPREAAAQWGSDRGWERGAFDRGYQDGSAQGARDARAARPLAFEHYREYQRADLGYNRSYGTIEPYRRAYRQGFGQGYRESYGRYGRAVPAPRYGSGYGYGNAPGYGQGYGGGYNQAPYDPRSRGGYGQGYGSGYGSDFGYQAGYADGFEKGIEDARKHRAFNARRHGWYRDGDHRYRHEYGPREYYKQAYRQGFLVGYERGYREAPRYGYRMPRPGDGFDFRFGFGLNWLF